MENKQNALDKELESFTEEKEAEIEKWDKYLEDVETIITESLGIVQANATEIGKTLTDKTKEYNLTVSSAVLSPWKDGASAIDEYTTKFGDTVSSTTEQLDTIKNKWQEVNSAIAAANAEADKYYNKKAATSDGPSVDQINKENANYAAAKQASSGSASQNNNKNNNNNNNKNTNANSTASKAKPSVGGTVTVKKTATKFGSKSGSAVMASHVPGSSYTVYQVSGDQVLIGRNGAYTGWVKLSDLQGYAKGTKGVKDDQLAWIDENGLEELVMHAGPNGRLQYLSKGTSVLNSELTDRIMNLAMNPQEVLDRNRPQIAPSKSIINNEISINMNIAEVVHVDEVTNDTLPELAKVIEKQMDSYMARMNNSLKRYTR